MKEVTSIPMYELLEHDANLLIEMANTPQLSKVFAGYGLLEIAKRWQERAMRLRQQARNVEAVIGAQKWRFIPDPTTRSPAEPAEQ
jgi:hypothetical protein